MQIKPTGYSIPQYTQRTGVNPYNKPYEQLTSYERRVVRYLKKEATEKAEWEAKPAVAKAVVYAGKGVKAVGQGIVNTVDFVKDLLNFQLFPRDGVFIQKGKSGGAGTPKIGS
jgi:hypothetical protein